VRLDDVALSVVPHVAGQDGYGVALVSVPSSPPAVIEPLDIFPQAPRPASVQVVMSGKAMISTSVTCDVHSRKSCSGQTGV